jgi:hypothetical protein
MEIAVFVLIEGVTGESSTVADVLLLALIRR